MSETPTLTMNGRSLPFEAGQTLLEVAEAHDIVIPTLCHLKGTTPTGACRVCVVEKIASRCNRDPAPGQQTFRDAEGAVSYGA